MTILVGGSVGSITIQPDTSGLTRSLVPSSRVAGGLVASSGYLGATLVGCLLLAAARVRKWTRGILWTIGALMLLTVLVWIRNPFGIVAVIAGGVALLALGEKGSRGALQFGLSLLAIQVALNAVFDIRVLFHLERAPSDAQTMARLFLVPAWVWASAWMIVSVAMLVLTLRRT